MVNHHLLEIRESIASAARASGRSIDEITLVAVTKNVPWSRCAPLYELGQRDFGENRVADLLEKRSVAPVDCRWHMIGTLQSNKVSKCIGECVLIHSVESVSLAEKISQCSVERGVITSILLQANISGESTKHGLTPEEWRREYLTVVQLPGIKLEGLMTIGPNTNEERAIRQSFIALRGLRDLLQDDSPSDVILHHLSMGMSRDFPIAIEEGATLIRVGSSLFVI